LRKREVEGFIEDSANVTAVSVQRCHVPSNLRLSLMAYHFIDVTENLFS
jgi:hypothetical protein